MLNRELGALLLILGMSIGAGMLALPAVTANLNFSAILLYLVLAWAVMSLGALALTFVQLHYPEQNGLISLARITLGSAMSKLTLLASLGLMYSLLCAYTLATGDVFHALLLRLHLNIPRHLSVCLAAFLLGSVVYRGIAAADQLNRLFMLAKIIACFLLIASILPSAKVDHLGIGETQYTLHGFLIMITAFGYAIILPVLGRYLDFDKKRLLRVVILGGFIPLALYLVWIGSVHAVLSQDQLHLLQGDETSSILLTQLEKITANPLLHSFAWIFGSICTFTAFLGVSIALLDLLSDALKTKKTKRPPLFLMLLVYLPPTLIALFVPGLFIQALAYAGIACVFLLIILPLCMWFKMRLRA